MFKPCCSDLYFDVGNPILWNNASRTKARDCVHNQGWWQGQCDNVWTYFIYLPVSDWIKN